MDNENNIGGIGSLISTFISFKAKLIIIISIFSFLLVIVVPVLLLTVLSSNIKNEDQIQTSSESGDISEENGVYDDSTVIEGGNPSKAGYIFPVAGLSKKNINNLHYPSYPGHT